jgi:hypothetical protein
VKPSAISRVAAEYRKQPLATQLSASNPFKTIHEEYPCDPSERISGNQVIVVTFIPIMSSTYDGIKHLIANGYDDGTWGHGSVASFIQRAVVEKFEREMQDYQKLGKMHRKMMDKNLNLCHYDIRNLQDCEVSD